jgi:hypothetical protein
MIAFHFLIATVRDQGMYMGIESDEVAESLYVEHEAEFPRGART